MSNNTLMKKTAKGKDERIGFFNKLKENFNPKGLIEPGGLLENAPFVNSEGKSEFAELMETLRDVDGDVREEEVKSKSNIKAAKSSFNRKEYIACISYLGQYHDSLEIMMKSFSRLKSAVDMKHNEFLFSGVDPEALEYFKEKLPLKFQPKTAGVSDWWSNLTSSRGRGLAAWEKRFPKFAKKFKFETNKLLDKADSLQKTLTSSLKTMASLRASRRLEEYLDIVRIIIIKYNEFDKLFQKYYDECVKQFIDQQQQFGQNNSKKIDPLEDLAKKYKEPEKPRDPPVIGQPPFPDPNAPKVTENEDDFHGTPLNINHRNAPVDFAKVDKFLQDDEGDGFYGSPLNIKPQQHNPTPPVHTDEFMEQDQVEDFLKDDLEHKSNLVLRQPDNKVKVAPEDVSYTPEGRLSSKEIVYKQRPLQEQRPATSLPISRVNPQSMQMFQNPVVEEDDNETVVEPVINQLPAGPRVLVTPDPNSARRLNVAPPPAPEPVNKTEPFKLSPSFKGKKLPAANDITAKQFLDNLTKLSNKSPIVLANEIIKFANKLNDKTTSDKLLAIAKNILK